MNTLAELISQYQPTDVTIELVRSTKIALLVGISGAGKDTVKGELLKKADYRDIISHTTRAPRANNGVHEVEGVDYHFVSNEMAEQMVRDHAFIEAKLVHGTVVYGTSVAELQRANREHNIAVTDIDVQGVAEYKELSPQVVAIFILPPDFSTWRARLAKRYQTAEEFDTEWSKRRDSAIRELTHALEVPYYHFIVNGELEHTVRIADEIAHRPDVFYRKDDEARLRARDLLEAIKISL